jgi:hypothetical protein
MSDTIFPLREFHSMLFKNILSIRVAVVGSRLISTQENYPWIGTDKKIFLCVKVISSNPELTRQRKIFLSVPIHG